MKGTLANFLTLKVLFACGETKEQRGATPG